MNASGSFEKDASFQKFIDAETQNQKFQVRNICVK